MSQLGCTCGHVIKDNTDFLPYKAYIREDEDTQKPIELLADVLAGYWEARQQHRESEFMRGFQLFCGATEKWAQWVADGLKDKPLAEALTALIDPFWSNYDRVIYECEECGRLWVEVDADVSEHVKVAYIPYLPETDRRHVLWSRHNHNPYGYLDE